MKRPLLNILLCVAIVCFIDASSFATTYSIQQITNNDKDDYNPKINASGQIVWSSYHGGIWEIFLYDPPTNNTTKVSSTSFNDFPQINGIGEVVWYGGITGIWLYDPVNQTTNRISYTTETGQEPQINDSGVVVWWGAYVPIESNIFLYDSSTDSTKQITSEQFPHYYRNVDAQINASGQVVWRRTELNGSYSELFRYDSSTNSTTQVTSNFVDGNPQINDSGQIVWTRQIGANTDIFLYKPSNGTTTQITTNTINDLEPQINASGQVVWYGGSDTHSEIFLYDSSKGTTTQITTDGHINRNPQINASGQVVWWGGGSSEWGTDFEIFLYDSSKGTTMQLTNNTYVDRSPQINDSGQVVWQRWDGTDYEIVLASPGPAATPSGSNVVVNFVATDTAGGATPVTLTFEQVDTPGETTLNTTTAGPPPVGFQLDGTYFDFETSQPLIFTGNVQICIDYSNMNVNNESNLQLSYVGGSGQLENITDSDYPDTTNHIICGTIDHLSRFAILEPAIVCPLYPVAAGTDVNCSYSLFYQPVSATATWTWGEEPPSYNGIGAGKISGTHTYLEPGVYTVQLSVTEDSTSWSDSYQYVVVYDPFGGFVTGGGWIDSPLGAYVPKPELTGKATFGFVSKYQKGANVPVGNTEFRFQTAGLNFHSDNYEWLVVTGNSSAQFKGVGTINGMGEYKFMLWARDNPDTFRIKIWEEDETTAVETVIYDNDMDQEIAGGSIVIHKK